MIAEQLAEIARARAERRAIVRLKWIDTGDERLIDPRAKDSDVSAIDSSLPPELGDAVVEAVRTDRARLVETADGPVFVHPFNPGIRVAIVGAVHIAQCLGPLLRDLGHAVTIIDPRSGFLTESRFPGLERSTSWPDEALRALSLDARTAVVTLSHDPKIDEPALEVALSAPCFYVGALGSRRTQEKRRARLVESGFDDAALARIHGPVGLDLGAIGPAEIALSIAAEIVAALRK